MEGLADRYRIHAPFLQRTALRNPLLAYEALEAPTAPLSVGPHFVSWFYPVDLVPVPEEEPRREACARADGRDNTVGGEADPRSRMRRIPRGNLGLCFE